MHESVDRVLRQIRELGGQLSAEALGSFFRQNEKPFGEDFDPEIFFRDTLKRIIGEDRDREVDEDVSPRGARIAASGGFNVIPSPSGPGGCSQLCVTFVSEKLVPRFMRRHEGFGRILPRSLSSALIMLSRYWFDCLHVNQETLILTSYWRSIEFEPDLKYLIEGYTTSHSKKVFIVEVTKSGPFLRYPY